MKSCIWLLIYESPLWRLSPVLRYLSIYSYWSGHITISILSTLYYYVFDSPTNLFQISSFLSVPLQINLLSFSRVPLLWPECSVATFYWLPRLLLHVRILCAMITISVFCNRCFAFNTWNKVCLFSRSYLTFDIICFIHCVVVYRTANPKYLNLSFPSVYTLYSSCMLSTSFSLIIRYTIPKPPSYSFITFLII